MHVECDGLSLRSKKEIFTATRAGASSGEKRGDLLLKAVREALSDNWLRQKLDEVVRSRQQRITSESAKRVRQMLDGLITTYRSEQREGGQSGQNIGGSSMFGDKNRQVHDPPSFLRFADHRPLEIESGKTTTIYLHTDGPDDLLSRRRRPAQIKCESDGGAALFPGAMRLGRVPVQLHVPIPCNPDTGNEWLPLWSWNPPPI